MSRKYPYGSPEYKIVEAQDGLAEILETVIKLKDDVGVIKEVKRVKFNASPFGLYFKGTNWSSFDNTNRQHIENAWANFQIWMAKQKASMDEQHEANKEAIKNNIIIWEKVKAFMKNLGVREEYSSYELPTPRHRNKRTVKKTAGFVQDLRRCVVVNDGYESSLRSHKDWYNQQERNKNARLDEINRVEKEKEVEDQEIQKVAMALNMAKEYKFGSFSNNKDLFSAVDAESRKRWIDDNYPDGTEVNIKCCSECNSWTVGEHRCSCGNRRMYLDVDGDFFKGYHAYPVAD